MSHRPSVNKPHRAVSKRLKLCQICRRVHENEYQTSKTLYYEDFPTYGLKRINCKNCKPIERSYK